MTTNADTGLQPSSPSSIEDIEIDIESLRPIPDLIGSLGVTDPTLAFSSEQTHHRHHHHRRRGASPSIHTNSKPRPSPLWRRPRQSVPSLATSIGGPPIVTTSSASSQRLRHLLPLHNYLPMPAVTANMPVAAGNSTPHTGHAGRSCSPAMPPINGKEGDDKNQEVSTSAPLSSKAPTTPVPTDSSSFSVNVAPSPPHSGNSASTPVPQKSFSSTASQSTSAAHKRRLDPVVTVRDNEGIEVTHNDATDTTEPFTIATPELVTTAPTPASAPATPTGTHTATIRTSLPTATPTIPAPPPPAAEPATPPRKETRRNSLLASSRKVVKATVVRPARAVTRVFRGGNSKTNGEVGLSSQTANGTSPPGTAAVSAGTLGNRTANIGNPLLAVSNRGAVGGATAGRIYGSLNSGSFHGPSGVIGGNGLGVATPASDGIYNPILLHDPAMAQYDPTTAAAAAASAAKNADWPVHSMESFTRQLVLVCVAYIVGVRHPEWLPQASRTAEFAITAWATCVAILCLSSLQRRFPHLVMTERDRYNWWMAAGAVDLEGGGSGETVPLLQARSSPLSQAATPRRLDATMAMATTAPKETEPIEFPVEIGVQDSRSIPQSSVEQTSVDKTSSLDESSVGTIGVREAPSSTKSQLEHPALTHFFVIDAYAGKRVFCNASQPHHISTEWFEMDMVVMIRTPDVDDPAAPKGTLSNDVIADYMRTKQRRFEFQYQVKLKKKPVGKQVYFSCELDDPIKMGVITKAFVGAAMAFVKSTNPTFHYSITGSKKTDDGRYEKPHMSFSVEASLDRLVVTKPGGTPPELGTLIHEDPESIKRRKKGILTDWNKEDTYTMALWSSYVDFLDWKVLNLPGIRPFGLSSVLGTQAINLTMYLIDEIRESDKHYRKDITEIIKLELSNNEKSSIGTTARQWLAKNKARNLPETGVVTGGVSSSLAGSCKRSRTLSEDSEITALENEGDGADAPKLALAQDDLLEEIEEVEEDVITAAELGEGIYLRSGDAVILREFLAEEEDVTPCSVANGGGFAVLQDQDVPIVIEKAKRSKKNKLIKSGDTVLFKMVLPKVGTDEVETRYLTIHRGWWLKWVSNMPTKNGYFTIFTHETEFRGVKGEKIIASDETQSSFLTLGGSFTLRHKRWAKFHVGIAAEPSTTYGGRMMALYNPNAKGKMMEEEKQQQNYHSDEEFEVDRDVPSFGQPGWMKPLVLRAHEPSSLLAMPSLPRSPPKSLHSADFDEDLVDISFSVSDTKLIFSSEHSQADVPAWIEMMDRVGRVRQLAYVVRVVHRTPLKGDDRSQEDRKGIEMDSDPPIQTDTFIRLRTGKELAHIMSIGQSVRISPLNRRTLAPASAMGDANNGQERNYLRERSNSDDKLPGTKGDEQNDSTMLRKRDLMARHSYNGAITTATMQSKEALLMRRRKTGEHAAIDTQDAYEEAVLRGAESAEFSQVDEIEDANADEAEDYDECIGDDSSMSDSYSSESEHDRKGALRKGKALLGKSAKLAKKTVVGTGRITAKTAVGTTKFAAKGLVETGKVTGKLASSVAKQSVKHSKKVVKGTVKTGVNLTKNTGKALIAPVTRKSNKPPKAEPKKKSKEKEESQMIGVSKKMRKIEKIEAKTARPPTFVAGELCAPEQSCRTASRVLSRMSNMRFMSEEWEKCNAALTAEVGYQAVQDRWFLEGSAVHLGVSPFKGDTSRGELLEESLVARCLWESHWREEWCGMYESCISFFAPLTHSPCLEIAFVDIASVRPLDAGLQSPLPGFPILVLETAWLCHYVAFRDEEARDTFGEKVEHAIDSHIRRVETASLEQSELRKARFWQGFQTLSETSLSSGVGKWAKIVSNQKRKARIVLNGRRMAFDRHSTTLGDVATGFSFVADLLTRALSFSSESLEDDPESFVEFLDLTSQLRFLPLDEIDLSSRGAFCLFMNLYHCLLQQALLLSVNGPLGKKSVAHFMRTSCYEIGGDVFSLAELQCCVIRGKMSRPVNPKAPYLDSPKKSNAYRYYALDYKDPRVHFVLNTGDIACPASVPVLTERTLELQLHAASAVFLANKQLVVDTRRRTVVLPKVCEVFRNDFGTGEPLAILKFCIGGMDEETANNVRMMLMDENNLLIKFHNASESYHSSLKLRDAREGMQMGYISRQELSSASTEVDI